MNLAINSDVNSALKSFNKFKVSIGHSGKVIDAVKFDLIGDEWKVMKVMSEDFSFSFIKQFCLTAYFPSSMHSLKNEYAEILLDIEEQFLFRKFHVSPDVNCNNVYNLHEKNISYCMDICYLNLNFLN
ncbi:hypothetical protein HELRODRAFT_181072 [Helobdella robusta]|uniref:Uncharacterized protein n=1 Tax=Helobdella robusta TaxID=6412 RepID=T1FGK8_HELRO|nr:hypothetical protein HELRODRAFT_181072 [Helobdella robusta]ESN93326.1 hypothetical protein HELRODRAFT_181072 [Helobdella robusta]